MRRIVPVPETARSAHAVFTAEPVARSADLVPPPPSLLKHFGATDQLLDRLSARPHATAFLVEAPVADAADQVVAARRDAIAVAAEHDGVVVDLAVPRIVDHTAPVDLAASSTWIAFDITVDDVTTRGLEAFGLPELLTPGVDAEALPALLAVLHGLTHRLVQEWPAQDPVGPASVTLRDVGRAFGDHEAETMPVEPAVDLLIAYRDDHLVVTLVDDPATLFA